MDLSSGSELRRVRLEPARYQSPDDESEVESDVTAEDPNFEAEYEVDAIKYAVYKDSTRVRTDGWKGWHYGVMWKGYLKSMSDTEEPIDAFVDHPGPDSLISQFWKAVGRPFKPRGREPAGKLGELIECPYELLRSWLKETKPRRDFQIYLRRRQKELQDQDIHKRDSDYYVRKKRLARKAADKAAAVAAAKEAEKAEQAGGGAEGSAGSRSPQKPAASAPQGIARLSKSISPRTTAANIPALLPLPETTKDIVFAAPPISVLAEHAEPPSPSVSVLDELLQDYTEFDSSLVPPMAGGEEEEEEVPLPTQTGKRKRIVVSPTAAEGLGVGLTGPSRAESPQKAIVPASASASASAHAPKKAKTAEEPLFIPEEESSVSSKPTRDKVRILQMRKIPNFVRSSTPEAVQQQPLTFGEVQPGIFDDMPAPPLAPAPKSPPEVQLASPEQPAPISPVSAPITVPPASAHLSPRPPSPQSQAETPVTAPPLQVAPPTPASAAHKSPPPKPSELPRHAGPSQPHPAPVLAPVPAPSGVSPPRPSASASASASPSTPAPAARPRYQQPKLMKTVDAFIDPESEARLRKLGVQPTGDVRVPKGLHDASSSGPSRTPGGISPLEGPSSYANPYLAQPPRASASYQPRTIATTSAAQPTPAGPKGWVARPPTGPSADQGRSPYQPGGASPILPMRPAGGVSPHMPQHVMSPPWAPNPPAQPFIPTGPSYNAAADPRKRAAESAKHAVEPVRQPATPLTGTAPVLQPSPPSPPSLLSAPPLPPSPSPPTPLTAGQPGLSDAFPSRDYATKRTFSGSFSNRSYETMAVIRGSTTLRLNQEDLTFDLRILRGSPASSNNRVTLSSLLAPASGERNVMFEMLDRYCLEGQIRVGARIVEWAKATTTEGASRTDWEVLKNRAERDEKIFVCYTESSRTEVDAHYALVLATSSQVDFGHLPLGDWSKDDIGLAMFLLALPLNEASSPMMPNPVKPILHDISLSPRKPDAPLPSPSPLLESYGLFPSTFERLSNRSAVIRWPSVGRLDVLYDAVVQSFKQYQVYGTGAGAGAGAGAEGVGSTPTLDTFFISNHKLVSHLRSSNLRDNIPRRTTIMSVGPTLALLPSQWRARKIWVSGGLVTFSPTFILRSSEKFGEIMKMIRTSHNWAAYVIPSVIEWAEMSWAETARCPDPTRAFETLTRSLFLDQQLLQFSGSAASSGGGLAISMTPPSIHLSEACRRYIAWLRAISSETDFSRLVELVRGVRQGDFERLRRLPPGVLREDNSDENVKDDINIKGSQDGDVDMNDKPRIGENRTAGGMPGELELIDIEMAQIEDLTGMRAKPEILPYRRYLYVGEMSLDRKTREKAGQAIEFVAPDDFAAVFSGAV